jgi:hypothetical protein
MKKTLLILSVLLLNITVSYSQASFNTGALSIEVSEYGRVQLYNTAGIQQLERASILVGTTPTAVFDYQNDANALDPTVLVDPPLISDFEIYGSIDNTYSDLPPDVIVKYNAYGWADGGYVIVKFNVTNDETSAIDASIGLDIIPYLNETYGFDSVSYDNATGVIRFHRGTDENMGMKLLSDTLSSLYSFEWYEDYSVDTDYWTWMHYGSKQPLYASNTLDGPVSITSQNPVTLAPGASYTVYYAMALGPDEETMLTNIAAAEDKYASVFVSIQNIDPSANGFYLGQNSPNPVNQSTTISYNLPEDGFVNLKVYNSVGSEVASLVSSNQTRGSHTVQFNANGLPSGMYYYTLRVNDQVRSNKMTVIK